MRKLWLIALTLSVGQLLASCAHRAPAPAKDSTPESVTPKVAPNVPSTEAIPLIGSSTVRRHRFANGLTLLVVEDHSAPTLAYYTSFKVGSRDEVTGYTGLAHLFEHMMFKGTTTYPEGQFDRILEEAGVQGINAGTNQDMTRYVQELPKEQLELITRLESDRMVNLVVNDQSFKTEREVVHNERRFRNENSPDGLMEQELLSISFEKHPYHWPVIGYPEDLDRMTAADAAKFYHAYYSPNHAIVTIVGDVTFEEARRVVEKFYGSLKATPDESHPIAAEPPQKQPRRKTLELNIQVDKLLMGYRVPEMGHPDNAALALLQTILVGGRSGRLQRALVEHGIATAVGASGGDSKDPSPFTIEVSLQKGWKAPQAESIVLSELNQLASRPVSAKELERARNQVEFGFYEGLSTSHAKAAFIGLTECILGRFETGLELYKQIPLVTAEQVQRVARQYFEPSSRTVIIGVPK